MLKIEKIEKLEKKVNMFKVFYDKSSFEITFDTLIHFSLYQGKEIKQVEIDEMLKYSLKHQIQEKALHYITYSPRTEFQVRQYIKKHLYKQEVKDEEIVEELVGKFKEYKYLNDEEYARLFVNSRLKNKPKSRYSLQSELLQKGIDKELSIKILDEVLPDSFEILKMAYEKKYKDEKLTFEDKKKISYLQRKGFAWNDISKLINSFNDGNE